MIRQHRHVGAYAVIGHNGKTLLVLKGRGPYTGRWDLPGGGLEHGETPEGAVRREIQEETGLAVIAVNLLEVVSHRETYTTASGELEDLHHVGMIYRASVDVAGRLLDAPDGLDSLGARWFEGGALASLPLTPFARQALQQGGIRTC